MQENTLFNSEIERTVNVLEKGGKILYPTETIWGIGCDAFNEAAVDSIFKLKKRPKEKNVILLLDSIEMLENYVVELHPKISGLLHYHVRPVTIIYPRTKHIPDYLLAEDGTIAMRVTLDPFCKALIKSFGKPIISTSANVSGEPFPKSYKDISSQIKQGVEYSVDYKRNEISKEMPSVIVKISDQDELIVIRK